MTEHATGRPADAGIALVLAVCFTALLLTLATALSLVASVERTIADGYQLRLESQYAAEAIADVAVDELAGIADWDGVLNGSVVSSAVDGLPGDPRFLADRSPLDLGQIVNRANCGKPAACSPSEMNAVTAERPWGVNNPQWRLFAYGNLSDLVHVTAVRSRQYVVALVGDDARENDADPSADGATADNPGCGILNVLAEAFGPAGASSAARVTVARGCGDMVSDGAVRVLAWREIP